MSTPSRFRELVRGFSRTFWVVTSSITSFFLLLGTLIFFREPERAPEEVAPTSLGKVMRDMVLVFRDVRFIGFPVIFSGFWIMFWQVFYSLPFYLTEVVRFERFVRGPNPAGMWWVLAGIGFVSTVLMVLYDRFVAAGPTTARPAS